MSFSGRMQLTLFTLSGVLGAIMLCGCQSATSYNRRGVQDFQTGQYQRAVEGFQQAIASNPQNADGYYNLAATLHDWGRRSGDNKLLEQSESLYHRCLDLSGNHVDCYRALAVLLVDTKRKDSAFTLLERWSQRAPGMSEPLVELARLQEEFGNKDSAAQYLAQALDTDSTNPRAWAALGRLREDEGRYAQALTNYRHAYNLNRSHPGVVQRIAAVQQRMAGGRGPGGGTLARSNANTRVTRSSSQWRAR